MVYRAPRYTNLNNFCEILLSTLQYIENKNYKHILVTGDFNVDFRDQNNRWANNVINIFSQFNLDMTIIEYTRTVGNSKSCLDNIFVNFNYNRANVISTALSDHDAQTIYFQLTNYENNTTEYKRFYSQESCISFKAICKMNPGMMY